MFKSAPCFIECGTAYGRYPWVMANKKIVTCLDGKEIAPIIGEYNKGKWFFYDYKDDIYDDYIPQVERCNECIALYYCGAGCPLKIKYIQDGSPIYCDIKKKYWETIFNALSVGNSIGEWDCEKIIFDNEIIGYVGKCKRNKISIIILNLEIQ